MELDRDKSRSAAAELRHSAEEQVKAKPFEPGFTLTDDKTQRLLHELQVHRIELETQNAELHQARDEVEKSLERYTDLYDFAPVGYFTLDRDGAVRASNLTGAGLLGIERSRLIGRRFGQFVAATDRLAFTAFLGTVFTGLGEEACEMVLLSQGNLPLIVQVEAMAAASGQECRIALIDITGRKQSEDALLESEERIYRLAEMAIDAIVLLDDCGKVTFCNAAAERMFGWPVAEIIGRDFDSFFPPEPLLGAMKQGFAGFTEQGTRPVVGTTAEVLALRKDGTQFSLELSISGRKLQGKCHAIGIMRDITERKSLEVQRLQSQKMETVGLLAGGIAHDINNILSVIGGYGTLSLMDLKEDDPLGINLVQIIAAADRGANLTRSLLNFSRKQPLNPLPIDVHEIIRGVEAFLGKVLGANIRLETSCTEEVLTVTADRGQIEQILTNLATNARYAMPDGGTLSIVSKPFEIDAQFIKRHGFGAPGKFVLISVTDTGTGMDRETAGRIFEPFFTTKILGEGTGLGLSLVYSVIKQNNGFIDVRSEPDKGTAFMVYLPLTDGAYAREDDVYLPAPQGGAETILLAEDDEAVRLLTSKVLTKFGYSVITATDGEDAVSKFQAHQDSIKLLLLDLIMPYRNGKEVYDEIRKICPETRSLFMSSYTAGILESILEKMAFAEGTEIIRKPFSPLDLKRKVREKLDEKVSP